ncbi:hypothetical protein BC567DRAFT_44002 [Phyllosticta citribraziliensis]
MRASPETNAEDLDRRLCGVVGKLFLQSLRTLSVLHRSPPNIFSIDTIKSRVWLGYICSASAVDAWKRKTFRFMHPPVLSMTLLESTVRKNHRQRKAQRQPCSCTLDAFSPRRDGANWRGSPDRTRLKKARTKHLLQPCATSSAPVTGQRCCTQPPSPWPARRSDPCPGARPSPTPHRSIALFCPFLQAFGSFALIVGP